MVASLSWVCAVYFAAIAPFRNRAEGLIMAIMTTAIITFYELLQNSQEMGMGTNDHLLSKIKFKLQIGQSAYDCEVTLRQPSGTNFDESIEVEVPTGYPNDRPWNHNAFRELCESYYRSCIGPGASVISISGGGSVTMRNNRIRLLAAPVSMELLT